MGGKLAARQTALLQQVRNGGLATPTHNKYRQMVTKPLLEALGQSRVQRVGVNDMQGIVAAMVRDGLAPRTIQYHFAVYRQVFDFAVKQRLISENPTRACTLPATNRRRKVPILSDAQVGRFLDSVPSSRYHLLFVLLLSTGLRIGEALALEWSDIDLEGGRIRVARSLESLYTPRTSEPKSKASTRSVPIGSHLSELLRLQTTHEGAVFESRTHSYKAVAAELKRVLTAIEVEGFTLHDLRHTACSMMLRHGANAKVVSEVMGHHSVAFTLDTYAHVLPSDLGVVMQAVDDALARAVKTQKSQPLPSHN